MSFFFGKPDSVSRVARDLLQTSKLNLAIIGPHPKESKMLVGLVI